MYRFPESPMVHLLITDEASELFKWNSQLSPPHPWQKGFWCSCGRWIYPYKGKHERRICLLHFQFHAKFPQSVWRNGRQSNRVAVEDAWQHKWQHIRSPVIYATKIANTHYQVPQLNAYQPKLATTTWNLRPPHPPPLSPPWNKPTCLT